MPKIPKIYKMAISLEAANIQGQYAIRTQPVAPALAGINQPGLILDAEWHQRLAAA
jgi:hypothetical protein